MKVTKRGIRTTSSLKIHTYYLFILLKLHCEHNRNIAISIYLLKNNFYIIILIKN